MVESKIFAVAGAVILALAVLALGMNFLRKTHTYSERAKIAGGSAGSKLVMACKAWLSGDVYSAEAIAKKYGLVEALKPFSTDALKCSDQPLDQIIQDFTGNIMECASGKDLPGICKNLYLVPSWSTLKQVRSFCLSVIDIYDRCCIDIKQLTDEEAASCLVNTLNELVASQGGEVCTVQAC